jgi:hypothetical protein
VVQTHDAQKHDGERGSATVPVACNRRLAGCPGFFGEMPKTAGEDSRAPRATDRIAPIASQLPGFESERLPLKATGEWGTRPFRLHLAGRLPIAPTSGR